MLYSANWRQPVFHELRLMVKNTLGMDQIFESIIKRLRNLDQVIITNVHAECKDTDIIDLVLVCSIDKTNLYDLTAKTEKYMNRKIRTLTLTTDKFENLGPELKQRPYFVPWHNRIN